MKTLLACLLLAAAAAASEPALMAPKELNRRMLDVDRAIMRPKDSDLLRIPKAQLGQLSLFLADKSVNARYAAGLGKSVDLLAGLTAKPELNDREKELYAAAVEDITVRLKHAEAFKEKPDRKVAVLVNTRKGTNLLKGYEVLYKLAIDPPDAATPFDSFSSPARTNLEPGNYDIWCRETETPYVAGPIRRFPIGGKAEVTLDVIAP